LIPDFGVITHARQFVLLEGVPEALCRLKRAGLQLVLVTNQAVVARGLISEEELHVLHESLQDLLASHGAPKLDAIYACPHHPNADLLRYRVECQCRKPRPGLLMRAAAEKGLDLKQSFMIGDRLTDVAAGHLAGCRTMLLETGQHLALPIQTVDPFDCPPAPDYVEPDLCAAAERLISLL
jgi:D-glycero-D-manno-heptose 1,7-bisphosphate phosphatase